MKKKCKKCLLKRKCKGINHYSYYVKQTKERQGEIYPSTQEFEKGFNGGW